MDNDGPWAFSNAANDSLCDVQPSMFIRKSGLKNVKIPYKGWLH